MTFRLVSLAAVALMTIAIPLAAHHSFAAEYDSKAPVKFKGVITKLDWMNPHVYFYVDVKEENGNVIHWACEAANPNSLARRGWKKNSLKPGDEVSVDGFRAKDGSFTMNTRSIVLADGTKVFSGEGESAGN
jgi:hypothetical protein